MKIVPPDEGLIKSLRQSSQDKQESSHLLELTKVTAGAKISLSYDALRELLEALALRKGFKIYNHECYVAFLETYYSFAKDFDMLRKERNAINYDGKKYTVLEAQKLLYVLEKLILHFRKFFEE